jgi:hypothetical protein
VLRPQFSVRGVENPERYGRVIERSGATTVIASQRMWLTSSWEEARALLPPGCYSIGRRPDDDPKVVATWMQ